MVRWLPVGPTIEYKRGGITFGRFFDDLQDTTAENDLDTTRFLTGMRFEDITSSDGDIIGTSEQPRFSDLWDVPGLTTPAEDGETAPGVGLFPGGNPGGSPSGESIPWRLVLGFLAVLGTIVAVGQLFQVNIGDSDA